MHTKYGKGNFYHREEGKRETQWEWKVNLGMERWEEKREGDEGR